jgi:hypothetical protein
MTKSNYLQELEKGCRCSKCIQLKIEAYIKGQQDTEDEIIKLIDSERFEHEDGFVYINPTIYDKIKELSSSTQSQQNPVSLKAGKRLDGSTPSEAGNKADNILCKCGIIKDKHFGDMFYCTKHILDKRKFEPQEVIQKDITKSDKSITKDTCDCKMFIGGSRKLCPKCEKECKE